MVANRLPANHRSRTARLAGLYWTLAGPLPIKTGREWNLSAFGIGSAYSGGMPRKAGDARRTLLLRAGSAPERTTSRREATAERPALSRRRPTNLPRFTPGTHGTRLKSFLNSCHWTPM
jgi:hypothetical protein